MFKSIQNFFSRQFSTLKNAHTEVSWEEALDAAIQLIGQIREEDLESETGKAKLCKILDNLKQTQQRVNSRTVGKSAESAAASLNNNDE